MNPRKGTEMGDLAQKPLLEKAPTTHAGLLAWVEEVAELTQPDRIYWVDGSEEENTRLTDELVAAGTLTRLNQELFPNSFAAFSDPADVARVEEQTFICSENKRDAGFTNNWTAPAQSSPTAPMRAKGFLGETWKWRAQRAMTTSLSGSNPHRKALTGPCGCSAAARGMESERG